MLGERAKKNMKGLGKDRLTHVMLIYRVMIPSVRLCGHLQFMALSERSLIEYRAVSTTEITIDDMNWADVVVLGRLDNLFEYEIVKKLSKARKYLVYMLDDDLLNIPEELESSRYYQVDEVQRCIRGMLELSNALLTPSKILQEKYANDTRKGILVEEPATEIVKYESHEGRNVKIGFAGSVDRTQDLESILGSTLKRIKREYGCRVQFAFFGAIPSFAEELDAGVVPYSDSYENYRRSLNDVQWDIGLAPMPDTPFHNCKHYNKFIEYAAAGITGVYSLCGPYIRLRNEIGLGSFCENTPEQWYEALKELIDSVELREGKRRAALQYAKEKLTPQYIADCLYRENQEIFHYKAPAIRIRKSIYLMRIWRIFNRVKSLCRVYRWRLPLHVLRRLKEIIFSKLYDLFCWAFPRGSRVRRFMRKVEEDKND